MRNAFLTAAFLLLGAAVASANGVDAGYGGVTLDFDGTLNCPTGTSQTAFCAGDSNSTEFIVYCQNGSGKLGSCSLDLVSIAPEGPKLGATCYEQSKTDGSAVCVYDGTEYDTRPQGSSNGPTRARPATASSATAAAATDVASDDPSMYILQGLREKGDPN
ncbi:hypothetical protein DRE_00141 [Drechslerella stenobrocha 248]|uniref:Cyanovirin-N domain-containing protein n=1 Tax=Drechslerella stenobrocha 248 TaxID=1043628 RepID=W7HXA5_9PEZI|nr:hypothetical protein DRE_00141 [Drechslerella stenobrocha 248]